MLGEKYNGVTTGDTIKHVKVTCYGTVPLRNNHFHYKVPGNKHKCKICPHETVQSLIFLYDIECPGNKNIYHFYVVLQSLTRQSPFSL